MIDLVDPADDTQGFRGGGAHVRIIILDGIPQRRSRIGIADRRQCIDDELAHIDIRIPELRDESRRDSRPAGGQRFESSVASTRVLAIGQAQQEHFLDARVMATRNEPFDRRLPHPPPGIPQTMAEPFRGLRDGQEQELLDRKPTDFLIRALETGEDPLPFHA